MSRVTTHNLKLWHCYMQDIRDRKKLFEVRMNDRDYKVNDILILKGWLPDKEKFTGQEIKATVLYILPGGSFGIENGYVIMSIHVINANF